MKARLLIDAIVRQTTVLVSQLATSGGLRAPLAHVANGVFLDLARELEAQGVSRKVSADMFGMALRAYIRKVQRLEESSTDDGRSLWSAVYEFLRQGGIVTRREVVERFHRDEEHLVRGMLHDLTESGLVFATGSGGDTSYRAATDEELAHLSGATRIDELLWAIVFTQGQTTFARMERLGGASPAEIRAALDRLLASGAVVRSDAPGGHVYTAPQLVVPLEARAGWAAAVYDHFQAVVTTICQRLSADLASDQGDVGGSTFTYEVWPGHPLENEVRGALTRFRSVHQDLRTRVRAFNDTNSRPAVHHRVIVYGGQSITEEREGEENK